MPYKDPEKLKERNHHYRKTHYEKNRDSEIKRVKDREDRIGKWLIEYKSHLQCQVCSESHVACLDFHHRDPSLKTVDVTKAHRKGWSIERIKTEIDKCDVLCANCHRKLHWNERQSLLSSGE